MHFYRICFFTFCFVFPILLPGQALQTTASEECQSKEEPEGKEDIVLFTFVLLRTDTLERVQLEPFTLFSYTCLNSS